MAKTKEYSATNKAPGIKEHILAALTRPMMVREIAGAIGSTTESVSKTIALLLDEGYALHTDELGRLSLTTPAFPKAPTVRTVREYEAMENPTMGSANGTNGNGQEPPAPAGSNSSMLPRVAITNIRESSINPRKTFDEGELAELAESIGRHGVLEPLLLRPNPDGCNPPFELLAGARRFRACKIAGVEQVPAVVRKGVSDAEAIEIMLAENEDRADLNPVERARAYQALQDAGYTQQSIAERIKRSQPVVANTLRLLTLSKSLQAQVAGGTLSEAHGRALLRHPEGIRDALAAHAVAKGLPSRAIDIDTAKLEWSVVYALRDAGAVRVNPHFEMCSACPHDALINGVAVNSGWCVNPACYDELEEAIKANVSAANVKTLAEARDIEAVAGHIEGEAEVPTLSELALQYPGCQRLSAQDLNHINAGCTFDCECRRQAQTTGFNGQVEIVQVCVNPERLKGLMQADHEARMAKRNEELERAEEAGRAERERLIAAIQERSDDPALLAAVVGRLVWTGEMDLVPEVVSRHAPDTDLDTDEYSITLDEIAALPPATLTRIAGELSLLEPDEAGYAISGWFLARPPATGLSAAYAWDEAAGLKIQNRGLTNQLLTAQGLINAMPEASRTAAETQRLLTEARQQVEARERTIEGLNKQIEHMRQARERVDVPATPPTPETQASPPSAELPPEMLAIADEMHTVADRMDTAGFITPAAVDIEHGGLAVDHPAAGFDTPGGGPDCSVVFTCGSCGATADASDPESGAGDWPTESLCTMCSLCSKCGAPETGTPAGEPVAAERPFAVGDAVTYRSGQYIGQSGVIVAVDIPGVLYQVRLPGVSVPAMAPHRYIELSMEVPNA